MKCSHSPFRFCLITQLSYDWKWLFSKTSNNIVLYLHDTQTGNIEAIKHL